MFLVEVCVQALSLCFSEACGRALSRFNTSRVCLSIPGRKTPFSMCFSKVIRFYRASSNQEVSEHASFLPQKVVHMILREKKNACIMFLWQMFTWSGIHGFFSVFRGYFQRMRFVHGDNASQLFTLLHSTS